MVEPARQEVRIIPAQFGDVQEEVIVREATTELVSVPATFITVQEEIVVRPAARRLIPIDPVYDTVIEEVVVVPERTVWKPGTGPIQKIDEATGEILCLVTEPAVTKQVERTVMIQPASTREEIIPAITEIVQREVVDQPARIEERVIPAETTFVTRRVEVVPARRKSSKSRRCSTPSPVRWWSSQRGPSGARSCVKPTPRPISSAVFRSRCSGQGTTTARSTASSARSRSGRSTVSSVTTARSAPGVTMDTLSLLGVTLF